MFKCVFWIKLVIPCKYVYFTFIRRGGHRRANSFHTTKKLHWIILEQKTAFGAWFTKKLHLGPDLQKNCIRSLIYCSGPGHSKGTLLYPCPKFRGFSLPLKLDQTIMRASENFGQKHQQLLRSVLVHQQKRAEEQWGIVQHCPCTCVICTDNVCNVHVRVFRHSATGDCITLSYMADDIHLVQRPVLCKISVTMLSYISLSPRYPSFAAASI